MRVIDMRTNHKWISVLFITIVCILLSGCDRESWKVNKGGLQVEIVLEKDEYCINEKIPVTVILTNNSNKPFLVDRKLLLLPGLLPANQNTSALIVTDTDGNALPIYRYFDFPYLGEDDFIILNKNQSINRTIYLSYYDLETDNLYEYNFEIGELYKVTTYYENTVNTLVKNGTKEVKSWTGSISASDTFLIKSEGCSN
jgi:hypothetical protein